MWDKFAKYFDVEMRKIPMKPDRCVLSADDVAQHVDENTIAVGAVLGTTHIGEADPIKEINDLLVRIKAERGGTSRSTSTAPVAASSRRSRIPTSSSTSGSSRCASINASGHKYGLVYPGVGWLIFRDRTKLPDELVFSVNYLGGAQPTYTFNFSRGSAMVQAQTYNFLRLGREGYTADRRVDARQRQVPQRAARRRRASSRSSTRVSPSRSSRSASRATPASTSTTCPLDCARTAGSCPPTAFRPMPRTCTSCASSCAST